MNLVRTTIGITNELSPSNYQFLVLSSFALIVQYIKTYKYDYIKIDTHCKNCGDRTNGLKYSKYETNFLKNIVFQLVQILKT